MLTGSAVLAASMQGGQLNHWGQCVLRGMKGETQARSYGAQRQRRNVRVSCAPFYDPMHLFAVCYPIQFGPPHLFPPSLFM